MEKEARTKTKDERIRGEKSRLNRIYKDIDKNKKKLAAGLIERAAFMRIECEDLEAFLIENGWTELFQQSEKLEPYDRARPQGQAYQQLNANYQKVIKQLDALLPQAKQSGREDDGFADFVNGRDEL